MSITVDQTKPNIKVNLLSFSTSNKNKIKKQSKKKQTSNKVPCTQNLLTIWIKHLMFINLKLLQLLSFFFTVVYNYNF